MSKIKTGVARECITPPLGTPMSGYFDPRYSKGVIDDLYATAIGFDDGINKSVIISLDLCGLKNQWWLDELKKVISEYIKIPEESIMVNCSHTHTGPIVGDDESSGAKSNKVYDDFLMQKVRDVAYKALENTVESKFFLSKNDVPNFSAVRQFRFKDGFIRRGNPLLLDQMESPVGETNNTVTVIKIERENGEDILIVNFWCHADLIAGEYISADYIGEMRRIVEAAFPATKVIFLQGAEGNIATNNPYYPDPVEKGYPRALYFGRKLAGGVIAAYAYMTEIETDKVKFISRNIKIPANKEPERIEEAKIVYKLHREGKKDQIDTERMTGAEAIRILRLENYEDEISFQLTGIAIGDLVFAGLPGEPFCEIGLRILAYSPFKETIICVLTNGGEIYFPTKTVMKEGKYVYEARTSMVKIGADDILVNEMTDLLTELKEKYNE